MRVPISGIFPRIGLFTLFVIGNLMMINSVNANQLTTAMAVERTLLHSPVLQHYPYQQQVIAADMQQAGLSPNPKLQGSLENILGTGETSAFKNAEITLSISQLIEMGAKRQQRVNVANARQPSLTQQYEMQRLDVVAQTLRQYYQALRLDALLQWNQRRIDYQQEALTVIKRRAEAGAVGNADVLQMQLRLTRAENQQKQFANQRRLAHQKLAANWADEPDFNSLAGNLMAVPVIPDKALLMQAISNTPAYLQVAASARLREAQIALADAESIADLTVSAGFRRFEGTNDHALVFGFSMPLQLQNRNQGNIARANALYQQELQTMTLTTTQISLALAEIHLAMQNNQLLTQSLTEAVRPVSKALLDSVAKGYELGQYSVLQWVDAQHELFAVERELIETRVAMHLQLLELERLTGNALHADSDQFIQE
ncbi:Heavy metal RND efflux outer membrane protein, CzcC family [Methylophaga frappieri]|uniref:Heavy metal RND efflux outer membrane protein, CzcC family n=1 Tax=Methylophaga frappieri (strain ATCC BAA-2434 / DSM 25690 / JAM7) TaxID=754477 RepID=I1YL90_METFJ|nr:TolC family protein [Methylophaga frappieri]AFJ03683.1 Heavy metal RND efflux outer membrane protein, CzcC family [Methylophaga frappieri]